MSDTKERELVDVSALIAGDVQFVQIHVWTEAKGLHMVKLRVVEEVHEVAHPAASYEAHEAGPRCSGCGKRLVFTDSYCPGCGNKIKR